MDEPDWRFFVDAVGGNANNGGGNGGVGGNQTLTPTQLHFLLAAYRVGIVALETLGRRAHDDRPQARYSRNPPYGEDVKWLLSVAKKLGNYRVSLPFSFLSKQMG